MLQWLSNITPEILTSLLHCLEVTCLLSSLREREPKGLSPKGLTFPQMHMAGQEKSGCFITSATNHICRLRDCGTLMIFPA